MVLSLCSARAFRASVILLAVLVALLVGLMVPNVMYAAMVDGFWQGQAVAPTDAPPQQGIPTAKLSPELLAALVTIVFSLAFAYLPGVNKWYGGMDAEHKAMVMGIVILLVGLGSFGASCGGLVTLEGLGCNQTGVVTLVQTIVFALLSSVGSYTLLVKPFRKDDYNDETDAPKAEWSGSPLSPRG